jgi:hypothetical protein
MFWCVAVDKTMTQLVDGIKGVHMLRKRDADSRN